MERLSCCQASNTYYLSSFLLKLLFVPVLPASGVYFNNQQYASKVSNFTIRKKERRQKIRYFLISSSKPMIWQAYRHRNDRETYNQTKGISVTHLTPVISSAQAQHFLFPTANY